MEQPVGMDAARRANEQGMAALQRSDPVAAAAHFRAATAADPQAIALWRNLAHACRLAGDDGGERAALDAALAIDRRDFVAQLRLAQLHQRQGAELEAMQAWSGVLQLVQGGMQVPPQVTAELRAGEHYVAELQRRMEAAADAALVPVAGTLNGPEARRVRTFVDVALGKRRVFVNQCAGVHYPFLPADEFFDREHFEWFGELEAAAPTIRAELEALLAEGDADLRPYVRLEEGTPANMWSDLDGTLDWGACFLWEYGVANEPVLDRCPHTAALLERLPLQRLPGRAPNAFFSLLRPGKRIPPHTGVTNIRAIVHLGLNIPSGCGFRVGGETREWSEGEAFAFDDTIEHEAWNEGDRRRAVLILDTWNPHLSPAEQAAITAYFAAADTSLSTPANSSRT